jgi:drug/metabolite transporter (DMT)-like permease
VDELAIAAVLSSTVSHAWWNYQAKRAGAGHVFFGVAKWAEVVLYLPIFVVLAFGYDWPADTPMYLLGAGLLVGANYFALSAAYARLDLSVAYPISRTSTLFLPLIAYFALGETIDTLGTVALGLVTVGVVVSSELSLRSVRAGLLPGLLFALLGALTLAGYTVWDKFVVRTLDPFLYLYGYNVVVALGYAPVLLRHGFEARRQWATWRSPVLQVAVLNTATYLLVLYALILAKASYVGALRQLSLVAGLVFGVALLGERLTRWRIVGVVLLVAGGILTTMAG